MVWVPCSCGPLGALDGPVGGAGPQSGASGGGVGLGVGGGAQGRGRTVPAQAWTVSHFAACDLVETWVRPRTGPPRAPTRTQDPPVLGAGGVGLPCHIAETLPGSPNTVPHAGRVEPPSSPPGSPFLSWTQLTPP